MGLVFDSDEIRRAEFNQLLETIKNALKGPCDAFLIVMVKIINVFDILQNTCTKRVEVALVVLGLSKFAYVLRTPIIAVEILGYNIFIIGCPRGLIHGGLLGDIVVPLGKQEGIETMLQSFEHAA